MLLLLGYYKFKTMPGALQEIYFPSFINLCVPAGFYLLSTITVRCLKRIVWFVEKWKSVGTQGRRWKYIQNMLIRFFFEKSGL